MNFSFFLLLVLLGFLTSSTDADASAGEDSEHEAFDEEGRDERFWSTDFF